jgi:hypothetical protein
MKRIILATIITFAALSCKAQNPQPFPDNIRVLSTRMIPNATQVWAVDSDNKLGKINIADLGVGDGGSQPSPSQTLTFSGNTLGLSDGNSINLSKYEQQLSISGNTISLTGSPDIIIPSGGGSPDTPEQIKAKYETVANAYTNEDKATLLANSQPVTLSRMATMPYGLIIGRNSGGTGSPQYLNSAQARGVIGLNFVDNTSDANKPISIAVQAALDNKQNLGGGGSYTPPQIISTTTNRNLSTNDIGNTIECTATSIVSIPLNFTQMTIGQTVNLEAHNGAEITIQAPMGVTINYVDAGSGKLSSRMQSVVFGILRKNGANSYIISGQ